MVGGGVGGTVGEVGELEVGCEADVVVGWCYTRVVHAWKLGAPMPRGL